MAEWFRNTDWNDEIEIAFDARLGRARDKAQYLNIQAHTLLASHPHVAANLCRRVLALDAPAQTARAGLYLGTALAVQGDVDGAISALEGAIEAEQREPMHRTAAYLDQALLITLARRDDLYDTALERLESERALPVREQSPTALFALTLIGGARGENVAGAAALALKMLGDSDQEEFALPPYLSIRELKSRLSEIAGLQ
jgi:tetratricopeptide (TPR) repeat protein